MSKKKLYLIIGGVILLLIIIIIFKGNESGSTLKVTVDKVQKRRIVQTVTASGSIQPANNVKISSDVSGAIVGIFVNTGQKVKKGQLLVKIDPKNYESAKQRAQATLNSSKANFAQAKANASQANAKFINAELSYNRNKKLHNNKAISDADYETSLAQYKMAKAELNGSKESVVAAQYNVASAEASLKEASDDLNKTTIYSPIDGTVSSIFKAKGEKIVGTNMMEGTEIMSISDNSTMLVYVDINENDIIHVHPMDTAIITVDAFLDKKFKGIVNQIANDAEGATSATTSSLSTAQAKNYQVVIQMLKSSYADLIKDSTKESPFKTGMSASADIITQTKDNVLSVPIAAVTTRKDTTKKNTLDNGDNLVECVFVDSSGFAKQKKVTTGIQNEQYLEIKSGLTNGEKVISGPYTIVSKRLDNGTPIEVVKKTELFKDN